MILDPVAFGLFILSERVARELASSLVPSIWSHSQLAPSKGAREEFL